MLWKLSLDQKRLCPVWIRCNIYAPVERGDTPFCQDSASSGCSEESYRISAARCRKEAISNARATRNLGPQLFAVTGSQEKIRTGWTILCSAKNGAPTASRGFRGWNGTSTFRITELYQRMMVTRYSRILVFARVHVFAFEGIAGGCADKRAFRGYRPRLALPDARRDWAHDASIRAGSQRDSTICHEQRRTGVTGGIQQRGSCRRIGGVVRFDLAAKQQGGR